MNGKASSFGRKSKGQDLFQTESPYVMQAIDKEVVRAASERAPRGRSMREVYLRMLADHYSVQDKNAPQSASSRHASSRPSFYQFRYWAGKARE